MITLRRAYVPDTDGLFEVERSQLQSANWGRDGIKSELLNSAAQIWCAQEDGRICGFVSFRSAAGLAEILNVAVHANDCRRGIGFLLLQKVLDVLKQEGTEIVTLEVNIRNIGAIGLYEKTGFAEVGRREKFYHFTDDAIIMEKKL